jgi:hypothetical protein
VRGTRIFTRTIGFDSIRALQTSLLGNVPNLSLEIVLQNYSFLFRTVNRGAGSTTRPTLWLIPIGHVFHSAPLVQNENPGDSTIKYARGGL